MRMTYFCGAEFQMKLITFACIFAGVVLAAPARAEHRYLEGNPGWQIWGDTGGKLTFTRQDRSRVHWWKFL